jgi:hypothetical protein
MLSLKMCCHPESDRPRILLSALFFDGSKRSRKRPLFVLFCENDRFSRDLLSTAQALKTRPAKKVHISFISSATTPGSETHHILG